MHAAGNMCLRKVRGDLSKCIAFLHSTREKVEQLFTKTKTHVTEQRLLLERARIVLRFSVDIGGGDDSRKPLPDEFEHGEDSRKPLDDEFVHIGYANLKTWFFSIVRLLKVSDCNANGYLQLTPLCCAEQDTPDHGIRTIVQFCAETLQLQFPIRVKIFQLVENDDMLQDEFMPAGCVEVTACKTIGEFLSWEGSESEAKRRKQERQRQKRKNNAKEGTSGVKKARKRRATHPLQLQNFPQKDASKDDHQYAIDDDDRFLDAVFAHNSSDDSSNSGISMADGWHSGHDGESDNDDGSASADNNDLEEESKGDPLEPLMSDAGSDSDKKGDSDESDLDELLAEVLAHQSDSDDGSDSSSGTSRDSSSSSSSSSSTRDAASIQKADNDDNVPQKLAAERRTPISEFTIKVDEHELHYNVTGEYMRAHCAKHEGCRRQRTIKPSAFSMHNRGQGRPVGLLVAWLNDAHLFDSRESHTRARRFSFEKRKNARQVFKQNPEASDFFAFERDRTEDESDSEPNDII